MNKPLLSVIVPIYNTEKFLKACIDSILKQSYKNLEIILVNDCSTDTSSDIIAEYVALDERIKVISKETNEGLYKARITGVEQATGKYIAFVDSDDTITLDWFRLLIVKAEIESADMVMANTIHIEAGEAFIKNNYMSFNMDRESICGDNVYRFFMEDEAYNFSIHTVWNKIYSKAVWDKSIKELKQITNHLIMAEDIAFSAVLFFYANKIAFSDHDGYNYIRHEGASTSIELPLEKITKNIKDIASVFNFFEKFLKKQKVYDKYKKEFIAYKDRNFRIYCNIVRAKGEENNKLFIKPLLQGFNQTKLDFCHQDEFFLYDIKTPWNSNYEKAKEVVYNGNFDVISFDLFDTLITRPFINPDDLFKYMEMKFDKYFKENTIFSFANRRKEADAFCRKKLHLQNSKIEDCTLTEIYEAFAEAFMISKDVAYKIMEMERSVELALCKKRQSVCDLIDLARLSSKKILILTDIYYEKEFIVELLRKNKIEYDALIVSSEYRKLKKTGALYSVVKKTFKETSPSKILHLGDNWVSDFENSAKSGLAHLFVPSIRDIGFNTCADNYVGNCLINKFDEYSADIQQALNGFSLNATHALVMNKMFDKPAPSWNRELRYNANHYFMGYYLLGSEMLGIANWIKKVSNEHKYEKIIFLARDGFVPKKIFDIVLEKLDIKNIKSEYFNVSRRSMLPLVLATEKNMLAIEDFMGIEYHSPNSIIELIGDYIVVTEELKKSFAKSYILMDEKFESKQGYTKFAQTINDYVDYEKLCDDYAAVISDIQQKFKGNVATFDIGYSGRIQKYLCKIANNNIDVFFMHSTDCNAYANSNGLFKIHNYFEHTPKITSIIREYFYSELDNACIGYEKKDGTVVPVINEATSTYLERYIQSEMVRGACSFVEEYCDFFKDDPFMFETKNEEMAIPFEVFLNNISNKDMFAFSCCYVEDLIYANYESFPIIQSWQYNQNKFRRPIYNNVQHVAGETVIQQVHIPTNNLLQTEHYIRASKFKKGLLLLVADRKLLYKKLKKRFNKKR